MNRLHDEELVVDEALVARLVARDRPDWRGLDVEALAASGSTNALFRLGEDLLVRVPRQVGGSATIAKEARWLPVVAPGLPVPVPRVEHVGDPGFGHPEQWSVVSWLDGEVPDVAPAGSDQDALAEDLAAVLLALRSVPVPAAAHHDPELWWYRAGPLADRDDDFRAALAACRDLAGVAAGLDLDLDAAEAVWDRIVALPPGPAEARWLHGDLVAENLLVRDGRLAAVLDFGGLAVGDPTVDLVAGWELLGPAARDRFRERLGVDEPTWLRGRAWALYLALMTLPYYWDTMPGRCRDRLAMARAVLTDATG